MMFVLLQTFALGAIRPALSVHCEDFRQGSPPPGDNQPRQER